MHVAVCLGLSGQDIICLFSLSTLLVLGEAIRGGVIPVHSPLHTHYI